MMIGERIKELRLEKGYSLRVLAKELGITAPTLQRYETGEISNISPEMVNKLAQALGTTGSWLLGEHEKDLTNEAPVVAISKTEKLLISIYRSLNPTEKELVRTLFLTLNSHHSDFNRIKFELEVAEEFIDSTEYSSEYTDYKNERLESTNLSDIDPQEKINAEIFDAIRQVDPAKAEEYANGVEPDPGKDGE